MSEKAQEKEKEFVYGRRLVGEEKGFVGAAIPKEWELAFKAAVKKGGAKSANQVLFALIQGYCKAHNIKPESSYVL